GVPFGAHTAWLSLSATGSPPARILVAPLVPGSRTHRDRVTERVREVLIAAGFYEAVTFSLVSEELAELAAASVDRPRITVEHSSFRHLNTLRQGLIPSLLACRRENERVGTANAELFEIARVYLEAVPGRPEREVEPMKIGLVTGRPFIELKGVVEALARRLNRNVKLAVRPANLADSDPTAGGFGRKYTTAPHFANGRGAEVLLNGVSWGWLGELDRSTTDRLDLRDAVTAAELDLAVLEDLADLQPTADPLPQFPAIARDLNFVLDEAVTWEQLETVVRRAAGPLLESLAFAGQYRGQQIPAGRKSYVVALAYRAPDRTLTGEEVDLAQHAVIDACREQLGAVLR
ncbi:MAG: hypothetical protein L0271_11650, partial [Gemmatimonadetes bacterium]|nr:hypothetical protein [Gemmatimonadota bacterium]